MLWTRSIRPLLLSRFPQATESDLVRTHGFAYGGCLVQDIGYYPFGEILFREMAHYVRISEFVAAMLRNARDVDELAICGRRAFPLHRRFRRPRRGHEPYREHIGFHVVHRLLYRTFQEVYGVRTRGILGPGRTALPSYRWAMTTLLPELLRAQIVLLSRLLPVERQDAAAGEVPRQHR
jgi:hypothetical protein